MKPLLYTTSLLVILSVMTCCKSINSKPFQCGNKKDIKTLSEIQRLTDVNTCDQFVAFDNAWKSKTIAWQKAVQNMIKESTSSKCIRVADQAEILKTRLKDLDKASMTEERKEACNYLPIEEKRLRTLAEEATP